MIQIPLNQLKPAKNNVRQVKSSTDSIKSLAASIESQGMLHNLVIKKNGTGYEVIDGNRRLEALKKIHGAKAANEINCIVIENNDNEIGLHANMMREDMHPLDECDVIYDIVADGQEDFDSVGKRFGQTKQWVKQRLALSSLSLKAKGMFRNYEFGIGIASALTLGSHEQQDKFLDDNEGNSYAMSASYVRSEMTNKKIPVSAALFDLSNPSAAVSKRFGLESDLFSDEVYITNREEFEEAQEGHVASVVEAARLKGYASVIYLKDEYWFDSQLTKGFTSIQNWDEKDYVIQDITHVIVYNSRRCVIEHIDMISKEMEEQLDPNGEEEEEPDLTPMLMSMPQRQLLHGYMATEAKNRLWEMEDNSELTRYMMAMLCHRRLGYTYTSVHRIGHIYADQQNHFPSEEYPDDYVTPEYEKYINSHIKAARKAFDDDGTSPLRYCLMLPRQDLSRLFSSICLTGISKHDVIHETFQETTPAPVEDKGWFKPDYKWLNKYKTAQVDMLTEYVTGSVKVGTKKEKVQHLQNHLSMAPKFDPYGEWPQGE